MRVSALGLRPIQPPAFPAGFEASERPGRVEMGRRAGRHADRFPRLVGTEPSERVGNHGEQEDQRKEGVHAVIRNRNRQSS